MNLTSTQLYFRLLGYVKPYWRTFAISILCMAITAATEPLLPALLKPMLDGTFINKDDTIIRLTPIFILAIFFVRGVSSFVGTYAIGWVGNKVVMDLRDAMFRKLLTLPTSFYDDHATGNLISKLTYDTTQVTAAATNVVTVVIRDSIIIVGLLGVLFYLNWKLTLLCLIMFPIIALIVTHTQCPLARCQPRCAAGNGRHHPSDRGKCGRPQGGQTVRRTGLRERPFQ